MSERLLAAIAGLVVLGSLVAPHPPSRDRIDPDLLLTEVLQTRGVVHSSLGELVVRNYTPLVEGEDVVSGRHAWVLRLKPRIKKRPWMQLWIDKKTFAVLASRCWDCRNRLRPTPLGPPFARGESTRAPLLAKEGLGEVGGRLGLTPLSPPFVRGEAAYLPSGYELLDVHSFEQGRLVQLVYSDGLFAISVFKRFPGIPGREHTQTTSAYACKAGSMLLRRGVDCDVIVVADLPVMELGRIADSVRDRGTVRCQFRTKRWQARSEMHSRRTSASAARQ